MGIVFPCKKLKLINKSATNKESTFSQRRPLKLLTLRNRIFLSSLPIFKKNINNE